MAQHSKTRPPHQRWERTTRVRRNAAQSAQRLAQELQLLDYVRTALARELQLDVMVRRVVEAIATTFGYTQVSLYLREGEYLIMQHQVGYTQVLAQLPLAQGVMGRVVRTGTPCLLRDVASDPAFLGAIDNITSEVCVPLFDQQTVVGVLNVESTHNMVLDDHDLRLMLAVSEHINIAIGRARALGEAERHRRILESITDAFVTVDHRWRITFLNPKGHQLLAQLGVRNTNVLGLAVWRRMAFLNGTLLSERLDYAMRMQVPIDGEVFVPSLHVWFAVYAYPSLDGLSMYVRDITAQKQAEQERLELHNKRLHTQKLETIATLAEGMAHDFNNLLAIIVSHTGLALLDLPDESPVRHSIEQIDWAARRASGLTWHLLAYAGKGRFIRETLAVNTLVAEVLKLHQASSSPQIMLHTELAADLPSIQGDAAQLRQALLNLVINAHEAIGDRPGSITIRTYHLPPTLCPSNPDQESQATVCIEVVDSGGGIPPAIQANIWEPFFTTKFTGRGLGLAAVQGIMRGHHGDAMAESTPERGAIFRLLLPIAVAPIVSNPTALPPEQEALIKRGLVLVVDDETELCEVTADILEWFGWQTMTAFNGMDGLALFQAHHGTLQCVIVDLTMPHMNGEQLLAEVRKHPPTVPMIVMSGYPEAEVRPRFHGLGVNAFLQKPFSPQTLQQAVERVTQR